MKFLPIVIVLILSMSFYSCTPKPDAADTVQEEQIGNPPADGFNAAESDAQAIEIADQVMEKMGGRKNWDATRFIHWTFFGRRSLLWDKQSGAVRIEMLGDAPATYLVNVFDGSGKIMREGQELTHPDSLSKYLEQAKNIWINDSYWLVMPFKLKDSGVTLKYTGQDTTLTGQAADVLQLTFNEVGVTPQNRYLVFVEKASGLVKRWDFYTNASDTTARFATPWEDYKPQGPILLSGNRGRGQLTDIKVLENVPDAAFNTFDPVDIATLD